MMDPKIASRNSAHGANGRATPRLLGSLLLAAAVTGLPACEKDEGGMSEAVEEAQDEVQDAGEAIRDKAREAKEEVQDEVDDHT